MHRPNQSIVAASTNTTDIVSPVALPEIRPTDGELLLRFTRGEQAAFSMLVDRHRRVVWLVCWQILRHRQDVEDTFQATFLILARRASSLRSVDSLAAWLHRVAYRVALRLQTSKRRHQPTELSTEVEVIEDKLLQIQRHEERSILLEELRSLPDRYQTPLILCYLEGHTRSAIADELGCTTAAVKGRLARGKRMLRSRLARRGIGLSVAMTALAAPLRQAEAALASPWVAQLSANCLLYHRGQPLPDGVTTHVLNLSRQGVITMTVASFAKPIFLGVTLLGLATAVVAETVREVNSASGTDATLSVEFADPDTIEETTKDIHVQIAPAQPAQPKATNLVATIRAQQPQVAVSGVVSEISGLTSEIEADATLVLEQKPRVQTITSGVAPAIPTPHKIVEEKVLQSIRREKKALATSLASLQGEKKFLEVKSQSLKLQAEASMYRARALAVSTELQRKELLNKAEQLKAEAEALLLEAELMQVKTRMNEIMRQIEQLRSDSLSSTNTTRPAAAIGSPARPARPALPGLPGRSGKSDPTSPRAITIGDRLQIEIMIGEKITKRTVVVEPTGSVALGVEYGRVNLDGAKIEDAEVEIIKQLSQDWQNPKVQVTLESEPRPVPASSVSVRH